jgi:hypothetical protein
MLDSPLAVLAAKEDDEGISAASAGGGTKVEVEADAAGPRFVLDAIFGSCAGGRFLLGKPWAAKMPRGISSSSSSSLRRCC